MALAKNDIIVVTGLDANRKLVCARHTLDEQDNAEVKVDFENTDRWKLCPAGCDLQVDVVPLAPAPRVGDTVAQIKVRVSRPNVLGQSREGEGLPFKIAVFPVDGSNQPIIEAGTLDPGKHSWMSQARDLTALDGHVFVMCGDQIAISTFSYGGNPASSTPAIAPAPPITAGSLDSSAMLFFNKPQPEPAQQAPGNEATEDYSDRKVITMIDYRIVGTPPEGSKHYSPPVTLAANKQLPPEHLATLVLRCPVSDDLALLTGDILVCRLVDGEWQPRMTYLPAGAAFAAMPLTQGTAPKLFDSSLDENNAADLRIEHFQLYWIPRKLPENSTVGLSQLT